MPLLLKDCGLEGSTGSVQRCPTCQQATIHFHRPGQQAICGRCLCLLPQYKGQQEWHYAAPARNPHSAAAGLHSA